MSTVSKEQILELVNDDVTFDDMIAELYDRADRKKQKGLDKIQLKQVLDEFSNIIGIPKPKESDIDDIMTGYDIDGDSSKMAYDEVKSLLRKLILQITNVIG